MTIPKITDGTIGPRAAEQYADAERLRQCPQCDSTLPAEWDSLLAIWVCPCCSCTWRTRPRP